VDAYTGKMSLYVFDRGDPIIQVFENVFPKLFRPASEMPPDLRRHARYPNPIISRYNLHWDPSANFTGIERLAALRLNPKEM
jgi:uncharacterized membrane protein (UPF0182 family)